MYVSNLIVSLAEIAAILPLLFILLICQWQALRRYCYSTNVDCSATPGPGPADSDERGLLNFNASGRGPTGSYKEEPYSSGIECINVIEESIYRGYMESSREPPNIGQAKSNQHHAYRK